VSLALIALIVLVGAIVVCVFLGWWYPGSGADLLDFDPKAASERRAALDAEDLQQMLDLENRRARERGLPEQTEDELARRAARLEGDPREP
jgi:hypothetical protein